MLALLLWCGWLLDCCGALGVQVRSYIICIHPHASSSESSFCVGRSTVDTRIATSNIMLLPTLRFVCSMWQCLFAATSHGHALPLQQRLCTTPQHIVIGTLTVQNFKIVVLELWDRGALQMCRIFVRGVNSFQLDAPVHNGVPFLPSFVELVVSVHTRNRDLLLGTPSIQETLLPPTRKSRLPHPMSVAPRYLEHHVSMCTSAWMVVCSESLMFDPSMALLVRTLTSTP